MELSLENARGAPAALLLLFAGGLLLMGLLHVAFKGSIIL